MISLLHDPTNAEEITNQLVTRDDFENLLDLFCPEKGSPTYFHLKKKRKKMSTSVTIMIIRIA
jgi:hypothetical protein